MYRSFVGPARRVKAMGQGVAAWRVVAAINGLYEANSLVLMH